MGFQKPKKVYVLKFEDPDMNGLVVKARSLPMSQVIDIASLDLSEVGANATDMSLVFKMLSDALVEWNLEDDGKPVPANYEELMQLDPDFALAIFKAWAEGVMAVSAPLAQRSSGGRPVQEASIPMEVL